MVTVHNTILNSKLEACIKDIPLLSSLTFAVKKSAKDILNLILGNSICTSKGNLQVNPLFSSFAKETKENNDIIAKAYDNTLINDNFIKSIMQLATMDNSSVKIDNLMQMLSKIREKETAYLIEKYMDEYESNKLQKILKLTIDRIQQLQENINETFKKLDKDFKGNLIQSIKVQFNK